MGHNEYYNVQGVLLMTVGDIVLKVTNCNVNKRGPCALFFPSPNIVSITISCNESFL